MLAGTITAQGVSDAGDRLALWLQGTQAIAAVATTIGVLIALYVAVVREPRKAAEEGRRYKAQMDALRRAVEKRVAAHARKVVPSCARSPILGDSWWTVRIDNTSKAATTILAVDVAAIDANGIEVPDGCKRASNTLSVDQAFERSTLAALSGPIEGRFQQSPSGEEIFAGVSQQRSSRLRPAFRQALRDAVVGHFATEWPRTLPPSQHTVMAYTPRSRITRCASQLNTKTKPGFNGGAPIPASPHAYTSSPCQPPPLTASARRQAVPLEAHSASRPRLRR